MNNSKSNFYKIIVNNTIKKFVLAFSVIVSFVLIILNNKSFLSFKATDSDSFFQAFKNFYELGFYDGNVAGYGFLYFGLIKFFYNQIHSLETAFFLINCLSQLAIFIVFIKALIFFKTKTSKFQFSAVAILTATQIINCQCYTNAYNDSFLGVFIAMIIYLFCSKIFYNFIDKNNFIKLGLLFAIAFSVRETAIIFIFTTILGLIALQLATKNSAVIFAKNITFMTVSFLVLTAMLHLPSLIENKKLCFYDKNPKFGGNWTQRNYLGLKKIQNGQESPHRDAIWKKTKFKEVNEYLTKNGQNSLPRNLFQVIKKDPMILIVITAYNFVYLILTSIRFYGFLMLFLIYQNFKKPLFIKSKIPIYMILVVYCFFSLICFTFLENRWFTGYEFLIPAAFLINFENTNSGKLKIKSDIIVIASLFLVTIFNLRSIYNLL